MLGCSLNKGPDNVSRGRLSYSKVPCLQNAARDPHALENVFAAKHEVGICVNHHTISPSTKLGAHECQLHRHEYLMAS